ncbi:dTDP-4-dehydrorhamnose 3,5-epimerase family protein [Pseudomonas sp. ML96]|uniref:dTDP-4-dehydrorhamnose 3,5-epimerase family protein n=1 Tax=Pseudomonas sp. ML96 TaxID=1523503 RepID=UPI0005BDA591|nr:dTDP-4-dehydrorhamnose 3,5-epimerase family protein [Pseudomonas sp. ML96]
MNITETKIAGAVVAAQLPFQDERGAFGRLFCERSLAALLGARHIVQINQSRTHAVGAVRGMHFQYSPHAEMKMVRCLKGRVWDVILDLRAGSPTFLQWHAEILSPEAATMVVIPEGCAHGFQVLEANSELLYLHTAFYEPKAEGAIRFDDPLVKIRWPLPVTDLSQRDQNHALLTHDFAGLHV